MQKKFIVLFAIAISAVAVQAQEDVLRPQGRPGQVAAQQSRAKGLPFRLGIEAGVNYSMASRDITGTVATSPFNTFSTGSGISPLVGIYAEVELSPRIAIGARFLYDMKSVGATKTDVTTDCLIIDSFGNPVSTSSANLDARYTQKVSYVTINPLIRVSLTERLFLHVGPVLQFAVSKTETEIVQTMDEGDTCRFNFGTPTESIQQTTNDTSATDPSSRFGLDLGIGYRIALSKTIDLVPRVGYQYMFTAYGLESSDVDTSNAIMSPPARPFTTSAPSLHSLQASLSLWFTL